MKCVMVGKHLILKSNIFPNIGGMDILTLLTGVLFVGVYSVRIEWGDRRGRNIVILTPVNSATELCQDWKTGLEKGKPT